MMIQVGLERSNRDGVVVVGKGWGKLKRGGGRIAKSK